MEWSKEKLEGTCVLIKSVSQSNRILKFYQSFGYFERTKKNWKCPESMVGTFIGPSTMYSNDIVHLYCPLSIHGLRVIELPVTPRSKFPCKMMVSKDKIKWTKRTVIGKLRTLNPFITTLGEDDAPDVHEKAYMGWKYAKEIDDRTAS